MFDNEIYETLIVTRVRTCTAVVWTLVEFIIELQTNIWKRWAKCIDFSGSILRAPLLREFYRGMEIHPRLLGVDVKQWTNCRVGMMGWQILILAFLIAGGRQGINPGHLANVIIQTFYITKFFWWETGYFNTLDITLDRAGYYICWGCLVWVPGLYTYSSFYVVAHPSLLTDQAALIVTLLGMFFFPTCLATHP